MNQTLLVVKSHTAILACEYLAADVKINRKWTKDGARLRSSSNRIWTVKDELRIRDTNAGDAGNYTCFIRRGEREERVDYPVIIQGDVLSF